jgi:hypothetical protein
MRSRLPRPTPWQRAYRAKSPLPRNARNRQGTSVHNRLTGCPHLSLSNVRISLWARHSGQPQSGEPVDSRSANPSSVWPSESASESQQAAARESSARGMRLCMAGEATVMCAGPRTSWNHPARTRTGAELGIVGLLCCRQCWGRSPLCRARDALFRVWLSGQRPRRHPREDPLQAE